MKNITLFMSLCMLSTLLACNQLPSTGNFGMKISEEGAINASELKATLGERQEMNAKVKGTVVKVCQSEGCWYQIELGAGESMTVVTKDHGYKLPKNCAGKEAIAEGVVKLKEVSVERLKHLAEDAGASAAEIEKITEAKKELVFEAEGVIIK
jgi:hypothetical protein